MLRASCVRAMGGRLDGVRREPMDTSANKLFGIASWKNCKRRTVLPTCMDIRPIDNDEFHQASSSLRSTSLQSNDYQHNVINFQLLGIPYYHCPCFCEKKKTKPTIHLLQHNNNYTLLGPLAINAYKKRTPPIIRTLKIL